MRQDVSGCGPAEGDVDLPLRRQPAVTLERVGNEAILVDRHTNQAHVVNESAARFFELCDGTATLDQLTKAFARSYELEPEDVRDDVGRIVETLRSLGVLRS
jgi:Coenzyme PQQ synthesis protein D (PqqD)